MWTGVEQERNKLLAIKSPKFVNKTNIKMQLK